MRDEPTNKNGKSKAKKQKSFKPKARVPRGLRDVAGGELALQSRMIATISEIYEHYGFDALDTPALEYADALGKFLPDDDRPNEGVFALQDDDDQWMSLRYDLTAPLARYVAQHYDQLPKPLRRYQWGNVWRNEKPGQGRFREFLQIDADTVGGGNIMADAEMCMMAADCMGALGFETGQYCVRINNRKIMDGLLAAIGLDTQAADFDTRRLIILRAMDKYARLGIDGVRALLGEGRKDESGDFTKGAALTAQQIEPIANMVAIGTAQNGTREAVLAQMESLIGQTDAGAAGLAELREMGAIFAELGYAPAQLAIDAAIVRGLGYYTGPVYEIDLAIEAESDAGAMARFGAVGGGGRYDDLVKRFKGVEIPATGVSIGISRLAAALAATLAAGGGKAEPESQNAPLVVVSVMDKARRPQSMRDVQALRAAGIRAELYVGDGAMKAQLRYADVRGARLVVIEGEDEIANGMVTLKDLALGKAQADDIADNAEWRASKHAQQQVEKAGLVAKIKEMLEKS